MTSSNPSVNALPIVDFDTALAEVSRHAKQHSVDHSPATEEIALLASAGRILAQPILADRDQPPFDRSTRDGFAVRAADFVPDRWLQVIGQVRAGDRWTGHPLVAGEAIEIMTGAPLPPGGDAVAMIEHVEHRADDHIRQSFIRAESGRSLRINENVVAQASEARRDQEVVPAGSSIAAAEIALAATAGATSLTVYARPTVAIVATGDELVELSQFPNDRQIRNSNSYALSAMVTAAGAVPHRLPIARDLREDLHDRITKARQSDLILLSGGVSMGKFDLVEEVLSELGAEFFFTGVKMQPGKPLVFGRLPERSGSPARYFFGLPGNPISTQVTFHCFVEPFLKELAGERGPTPKFVQATLDRDVEGKEGLTRVLPARLTFALRQPTVQLVAWHGSGDLAANGRANCYAVFPPEGKAFRAGEVITVLLR